MTIRHDMEATYNTGIASGNQIASVWGDDCNETLDDKISSSKTANQAVVSNVDIVNAKSLTFGTDVGLTRGAADRLDLATGDSLNLVSGSLMVAAAAAIDSSRAGDLTSLELNSGGITNAGSIAGVTSIAGQTISLSSTSDVLTLNQTGSGNIIVGQDGGTPVFVVSEPGKLTTFGGFGAIDVYFANGTTYKIEADGDAVFKDIQAGGATNQITNFKNLTSAQGVSKPFIILDSVGSGDGWTARGSHVSIGEDAWTEAGVAAMRMSIVGGDPAYGYLGMGGLTAGIPAYYLRFVSNSAVIRSNSKIELGSASYYLETDGDATLKAISATSLAAPTITATTITATGSVIVDEIKANSNWQHHIEFDPVADQLHLYPGDISSDNYIIFQSNDAMSASPRILPSSNDEGGIGWTNQRWNIGYFSDLKITPFEVNVAAILAAGTVYAGWTPCLYSEATDSGNRDWCRNLSQGTLHNIRPTSSYAHFELPMQTAPAAGTEQLYIRGFKSVLHDADSNNKLVSVIIFGMGDTGETQICSITAGSGTGRDSAGKWENTTETEFPIACGSYHRIVMQCYFQMNVAFAVDIADISLLCYYN